MQQLHLVGLTTDHTGLVLSTRRGAKTGKYSIAADDKLLAAVQEAKRLLEGGDEVESGAGEGVSAEASALPAVPLPPPPVKRVSSLSPREIQGRLRAGGTVSEIAAAAGVDEEWILRFADPIRAEQARVVEQAQRLTFHKPRLGLSAEPLETSVLLNLAERGVRLPSDVFAMAWTAFNLHGTNWAVLFSYKSRQRRQTAQWEVDLRSGELTARNRLASDLGYLEPGRRRRRLEPLEVPGEEESPPSRRRGTPKAAGARTHRTPAAKAAAGKRAVAAKKPAAKKPAAKKPATATRAGGAKVAAARKSPAATASGPVRKAPAVKKAPAAKSAAKSTAKGGGRQSSAKARRPAKKPAAKKPAPGQAAVDVAAGVGSPSAPVLPERPTHLARPPSPMNQTNRAVTLPGRLVGAPSLRPTPQPAARPRPPAPRPQSAPSGPSFRPRPRPDDEEPADRSKPDAERPDDQSGRGDRPLGSRRRKAELSASPAASGGDGADIDGHGGAGDGAGSQEEKPQPRARRQRSERRITPRDGEEPSVVILSTPAVRRLESPDEQRRGATAPPS